jgi:hypothetical protein
MPRRAISPQQKADIKALIVKSLKTGCSRRDAYGYAGIDQNTFHHWMDADREFKESIEKAECEAAVHYTSIIISAADKKNWQAAAWWLERKRPDDFGRKDRTVIAGDKENPLQVEAKIEHKLDAGTIKTALDILRDAGMLEPPTDEPTV